MVVRLEKSHFEKIIFVWGICFPIDRIHELELTMKHLLMGLLVEVLEPADLRATMAEEPERLYQVNHIQGLSAKVRRNLCSAPENPGFYGTPY